MTIVLGKPYRKFRIIIQERKTDNNKIEKSRSFMISSYDKKISIDAVKKKLENIK